MKTFLSLLCFLLVSPWTYSVEIGHPIKLHPDYQTGDTFMSIELLGMLELSGVPVQGLAAHELSALAWDEDDQLLYALSDKGYFLRLKPRILDERLIGITLVDSHVLQDESRNALSGKYADAEGMSLLNGNNGIAGDAELVISFEIVPRIVHYNAKGNFIETFALPKHLQGVEAFSYRNGALESLAWHPDWGYITAPQLPLAGETYRKRSLYSLEGHRWSFEPVSHDHSSITDLEFTPDGDVLILERNYANLLSPIQILLRRGTLSAEDDSIENLETVAVFDSSKSWRIDNYEGLAHHKDDYYFLISDDNQNLFQSTYLIYFKLL